MAISIEEANAIINKTDARHEQFYRNDPTVVGLVNDAYARQHPGEIQLNGHTPRLEEQMADAMKDQLAVPQQGQPQEGGATLLQDQATLPPEVAKAATYTMTELRGEWGAQTESQLKTAAAAAQEMFGSAAALEEFAAKYGIDRDPKLQAEAVKFLAKLKR